MLTCTVNLQVAPYYGPSHTAIAVGHKVYSFGGFGGYFREGGKPPEEQLNVYVFNTVSLRWKKLPPGTTTGGERPLEVPCMRRYHTGVLIGDLVYIWGGIGLDIGLLLCNNILYAFDVDAHRWLNAEVSGTVPEASWGHSACVWGKVMYIHGGWNSHVESTNDIYKLETASMVWSLVNTRGTLPPAPSGHSATIIGTKMFVFGGAGDQEVDINISVFDTENNCWLSTPSSSQPLPKGRWFHSAFAYNGELYICGGLDKSENDKWTINDDMWKLSPETFSWKEVKPTVNDSFWMERGCCCMVGSCVFIFGGYKGDQTRNVNLYVLDFNPSLKTLCKLAVIQHGLEQSELPHDIRWELAAMTGDDLWLGTGSLN